jgi:signal transduction histidine kinase
MEEGKMIQSVLISNDPLYVNHFSSIFEDMWKNGVDAVDKITAIEQGLEQEFLEVITDRQKASQILVDLAKSVKKEALVLFPNDRAMLRVDRLGIIDYLIHASRDGAEVKIICPLSSENADIVERINSNAADDIKILNGNNSLYGTFIVDGEKFLRAELREPNAMEFSEAIGFTIYSNSRRSAESFKSVFELLWKERTLNEELKRADIMQKEFLDIAAHELRTPIQPILGLTEILRSQIKDLKQRELLDITIRNAKRLQRLTEDILDVTKIETKTLDLKKELFDLNEMILNVITDYKNQVAKENKGSNLTLQLIDSEERILIEADKGRINQVISNLLSNAIKFTNEGSISIAIEKKNKYEEKYNEVIVSIKDTGTGIDPAILPRLFTKFATKSTAAGGTGLGLFISKSIIEAHGGKIWAGNNTNAKGATFTFSVPPR